ncbi:MAG: hypothetical protein ACP5D8_06680 [Fidelibacterota bacterium]
MLKNLMLRELFRESGLLYVFIWKQKRPIWLDAELGGWKGITPLREIYTRPGYDETDAVTRSRVLYYDSALMKHFGPRQVVATQKLAYLLHPEYFESPEGTIPWELGWIK